MMHFFQLGLPSRGIVVKNLLLALLQRHQTYLFFWTAHALDSNLKVVPLKEKNCEVPSLTCNREEKHT
jgi:hypothetical protein